MKGQGGMRGITLVELMVVIVILAVVLGLASMGADVIRGARLSGATQQLLADIQLSRIQAMTHDAHGFGIRFQSATSYVVFRFNDCNDSKSYDTNTCAGHTREEADTTVKRIPPSVVLKKTLPSTDFNNDILIYDPTGVSRSATGALGNMTILVKNDDDETGMHCITISTIRVREGVWGWDHIAGAYKCRGT